MKAISVLGHHVAARPSYLYCSVKVSLGLGSKVPPVVLIHMPVYRRAYVTLQQRYEYGRYFSKGGFFQLTDWKMACSSATNME
jgi:hypothetical protein